MCHPVIPKDSAMFVFLGSQMIIYSSHMNRENVHYRVRQVVMPLRWVDIYFTYFITSPVLPFAAGSLVELAVGLGTIMEFRKQSQQNL